MPEKKMYLTEEEAAAKLGVSIEQLTDYAREGKLQQYRDGTRNVYRADQIEQLASETSGLNGTDEIELAPADTISGDTVSLSEAEIPPAEASKEDTVITAEGISIFDDEDLEIETADPMAKTQIAPSLEDQISLEGVGSGSGLLDLTRESDDTSLGAEVLEHIDMESGMGAALEVAEEPDVSYPSSQPEIPFAESPVFVETLDPGAGLFGGLIMGCSLVVMVLGSVMISAMTGRSFAFIETLKNNMVLSIGGAALIVIICGVFGLVLAKSTAARQTTVPKESS